VAIVAKQISMQEAADTYGVSTKTIRRYIASGRLTAYRVGPRLIRLDAEQVRDQLLGSPVGGGDAA
jgi:excisionase family DNA binding protein